MEKGIWSNGDGCVKEGIEESYNSSGELARTDFSPSECRTNIRRVGSIVCLPFLCLTKNFEILLMKIFSQKFCV